MIIVAAAACFVAAFAISSWSLAATAARQERRQHARERELLINQILHLTGKTWTPPPAETWQSPEVQDDFGRYVAVPEQMPDDEDWERER